MFDLDIKVSSNEYFDLIRKLECLTSENEHLKGLKKKNDELRELIDFKRKQIEEQATTIRDLDKKLTELKKKLKSVCETCDVPDNCVNASEAVLKDADAKIQSANDKAANAKEKAREANERAERYRGENVILRKRLQQVEEFNSNLLKEFARKEMNNGNANPY